MDLDPEELVDKINLIENVDTLYSIGLSHNSQRARLASILKITNQSKLKQLAQITPNSIDLPLLLKLIHESEFISDFLDHDDHKVRTAVINKIRFKNDVLIKLIEKEEIFEVRYTIYSKLDLSKIEADSLEEILKKENIFIQLLLIKNAAAEQTKLFQTHLETAIIRNPFLESFILLTHSEEKGEIYENEEMEENFSKIWDQFAEDCKDIEYDSIMKILNLGGPPKEFKNFIIGYLLNEEMLKTIINKGVDLPEMTAAINNPALQDPMYLENLFHILNEKLEISLDKKDPNTVLMCAIATKIIMNHSALINYLAELVNKPSLYMLQLLNSPLLGEIIKNGLVVDLMEIVSEHEETLGDDTHETPRLLSAYEMTIPDTKTNNSSDSAFDVPEQSDYIKIIEFFIYFEEKMKELIIGDFPVVN